MNCHMSICATAFSWVESELIKLCALGPIVTAGILLSSGARSLVLSEQEDLGSIPATKFLAAWGLLQDWCVVSDWNSGSWLTGGYGLDCSLAGCGACSGSQEH